MGDALQLNVHVADLLFSSIGTYISWISTSTFSVPRKTVTGNSATPAGQIPCDIQTGNAIKLSGVTFSHFHSLIRHAKQERIEAYHTNGFFHLEK